MKLFIFMTLSLLACLSNASTKGHFLGLQGMIQLFPTDGFGGSDPDTAKLSSRLVRSSFHNSSGSLNFICAKVTNGSQCTILVKSSPEVFLSPEKNQIQFQVTGIEATELRSNFLLNPGEDFHLISSDGYFRIDVESQKFSILFDGNGL